MCGTPGANVISDFEQDTGTMISQGGRTGYWYVFADTMTGTQTPTAVANGPTRGQRRAGGATQSSLTGENLQTNTLCRSGRGPLSPLFSRRSFLVLLHAAIGIVFIVLGWILATIPGPMGLLVFGVHPFTFWSVDYTPIFPWMGLVLIGLAAGEFAYPRGVRKWTFPRNSLIR